MRLYFPVDLTGNFDPIIEKLVLGGTWIGDI